VFLAFGWAEGEPTHFVPCLAATICQRRSRSDSVAFEALSAGPHDGIAKARSWERSLTAALVGRDVDMNFLSVIRNGASRVVQRRRGEEMGYLNSH
jgi:hypothetical protein